MVDIFDLEKRIKEYRMQIILTSDMRMKQALIRVVEEMQKVVDKKRLAYGLTK